MALGSAWGTTGTPSRPRGLDPFVLFVLAAVLLAALAFAWTVPIVAAWLHSGRMIGLSPAAAARAVIGGRLLGSDPASAYPLAAAEQLPGLSGVLDGGGAGRGRGHVRHFRHRAGGGDSDESARPGPAVVAAARAAAT